MSDKPDGQRELRESVLYRLHGLYGVDPQGGLYTYEEGDQYELAADAIMQLLDTYAAERELQARMDEVRLMQKTHYKPSTRLERLAELSAMQPGRTKEENNE